MTKDPLTFSFYTSSVHSYKLRLHGASGNYFLFARFFGYISTTEYKYISISRFYTVGVSGPVVVTVSFYYFKISSANQIIANYTSKIFEYFL